MRQIYPWVCLKINLKSQFAFQEVVIVSSTEKEPDPDVQEIVEKYSSSIGKLSDVAQTPSVSFYLLSETLR